MKNMFKIIFNIVFISIAFSQVPCILGDVYVSEGANHGDPEDYIEVYNGGGEECTLAGFQLDDTELLEDFTFGNIIWIPVPIGWAMKMQKTVLLLDLAVTVIL